jgi:tRNA A-37 threonylcarbamoyl transferase component Bud32
MEASEDPALLPDTRYIAGVTAPAADVGLVPGTILLDRYRVIRELGVGGMSQVVCAEHVSLGTKVAMKFLLPELAVLPDAPQRFVREAKAATRFKSDHVAQVLDEGVLPDGTPYMVMEYLEGKDLGRYLREGKRFGVTEAVDLVVQTADALARAHAAGVIHRDVKPSNLFLTSRPDGTPLLKVLDFGISKVVEEAAKENLELTKTTVVMGSALYMSLEQMRSTKTVDHRTDIYALGVSLYELLTGTHPFTAESFSELCVKVSLDPPAPLRDHRPDVPAALAAVLEIAYARTAPERYQTVGSFAAALLPFADARTAERIAAIRAFERGSYPDGKIPERQPTPLGLRVTTVQRPPLVAWWIYAAAAGAGLAAAGALWFALAPPQATGSAGSGGVVTVPDAAVSPADASTAMVPLTVPSTGPLYGSSGDAGPLDAGDAGDAGKAKPSQKPCKPGEMVRMPNGLLKPCGL